MKLLLIVDDYLPHSKKIAAKMMHELAIKLHEKGHLVSVLTPYHNIKERYTINFMDGIEIIYFKSGKLKNISKFRRAVNETLLSFNAFKNCNKFFKLNTYDGIIYFSPSIFFGSLVSKLKKIWKCNSYLILRDVFPQWAVDNGLIKKRSLVHIYFSFFERLNYQSADRIGVMSNSNLKYFRNRFKSINKFEVLFNWSSISKRPKSKIKYRKKLLLEEKIVFFYGGNIGFAQQIINLIYLAKGLLSRDDIHFVFVGNGDEVNMLVNKIKNSKLSNITYLPPVNQDEYLEMLNEFDVGLFSLHPDHKTHNFPGKLLGYMNYEKPILGCVNSGNDLKVVINKNKAGLVSDTGNHEEMIKNALELANNKKLRILMGNNGKKLLINQFSVSSAASKIEKAFI